MITVSTSADPADNTDRKSLFCNLHLLRLHQPAVSCFSFVSESFISFSAEPRTGFSEKDRLYHIRRGTSTKWAGIDSILREVGSLFPPFSLSVVFRKLALLWYPARYVFPSSQIHTVQTLVMENELRRQMIPDLPEISCLVGADPLH